MDIMVVINQMVMLFLLMALGYIVIKVRLFTSEFRVSLSKFIINVTLPALMIASVTAYKPDDSKSIAYYVFFIAIVLYAILPIVGKIIATLIRANRKEHNTYVFMTVFSNIGFMGFPVIGSMYGNSSIFYVAVINLIFNLLCFTYGVYLFIGRKGISLKRLLQPGIIASTVAIIIFLLDIPIPNVVANTFKSIGDTTSPLAMVVIGMSFADIPIKSIFNDVRIYIYTFIKQIVLPIIAWLVLRNIIDDELILGVLVVVIAMPIAIAGVLFANEYDKDIELITRGIFITTLASLITIPIIAYVLL